MIARAQAPGGLLRRTALAPRRWAGRGLRRVRSAVEGALHPLRRRRARRRLARISHARRVLFLCLGNICRSPWAEARFRQRVRERALGLEAASAGFIGPGRPPPEHALAEARARGLDTADHRSRLVTAGMVEAADVVVVMDPGQARRLRSVGARTPAVVLGDLDPAPVTRHSIRDPWGADGEVFRDVFDRIDRCVDELVRILDGPVQEARTTVAAGARSGAAED